MPIHRILIIGSEGGTNVGGSLLQAAQAKGVEAKLLGTEGAMQGSFLQRQISWRVLGHRPAQLRAFGRNAVEVANRVKPQLLICTGHAPLEAEAVRAINAAGVVTMNYSTDDPWNPSLRSEWFLQALACYHWVFTPRLANLGQLQTHCSGQVEFLPFGYDPALFYPESLETLDGTTHHEVLFVGGADAERARHLGALDQAGIEVGIYGSYWERYRQTKRLWRRRATPEQLRRLTCAATLSVTMPRLGNRDGHVMRSLEIPATGAAMVASRSSEHSDLLGEDGDRARYFSSPDELVECCKSLLAHNMERQAMAMRGYKHLLASGHTYADRLAVMLNRASTRKYR